MRRASKILTLILVVVFLFGIFAGCDLVGKDVAKYRGTTAITVGDEEITVGKLLDTFNSYYNNYYYYVSAGYFTIGDVLDIAVQALVNQYMKVDAYKKATTTETHQLSNGSNFNDAKYLTQDQLDYSISYVKYLMFTSFDSSVLEKIEAKYELGDAEAEDTSRDFYKFDDLQGAKTYSEYYLNQNFQDDDMDEYIDKYFGGDKDAFKDADLSNLQALYVKSAQAMVDELNKRVEDGDEQVDKSVYEDYQKAVYKQYENTIKNNYEITLVDFVNIQIEDLIRGGIVALYDYSVYSKIEDPKDDMLGKLAENYATLKAAQKAEFTINKNYESFVENLSSSSFLYTVPEGRDTDYVFVRNILIPFSANQTVKLNSLKAELGTEKDAGGLYVKYRNSLAKSIAADDFLSEKDTKGKYAKVENLFKVQGDKLVLNYDSENALNKYLKADGSVQAMEGKTADETIVELMKQFNTDTAQHSALYGYVVRVGDVPSSYRHQWVDEFVQATNDAMALGGAGNYGIAVSNYGVHIVYVQGYVADLAKEFDFATNYLNTHAAEYRLFKTYFETQQSTLVSEALEDLRDSYVENGLIKETKVFAKFLKENKIEYDLAKSLSDDED